MCAGMDRELPAGELRSAKRKKIAIAVGLLAVAAAGYWALGAWLRPSVDRRDLRLAHVEAGSIESTLEAAGTVVPLEERLVTSPAEASLLRVLHRAGDHVAAGEPILVLDVSGLEVERNTKAQQLALKVNEGHRAELAGQHKLDDLEATCAARSCRLRSSTPSASRRSGSVWTGSRRARL